MRSTTCCHCFLTTLKLGTHFFGAQKSRAFQNTDSINHLTLDTHIYVIQGACCHIYKRQFAALFSLVKKFATIVNLGWYSRIHLSVGAFFAHTNLCEWRCWFHRWFITLGFFVPFCWFPLYLKFHLIWVPVVSRSSFTCNFMTDIQIQCAPFETPSVIICTNIWVIAERCENQNWCTGSLFTSSIFKSQSGLNVPFKRQTARCNNQMNSTANTI